MESMQTMSDVYDSNGNLNPGVQVFGVDADGEKTDVTEDWRQWSSTEPKIEVRQKEAGEVEEPKPDDWLGDDYSGDYCDLRNLLRNKTIEDMVEFIKKTDRRRVLQIREHLLICAAYEKIHTDICCVLILLLTRCSLGDFDIDEEYRTWFDDNKLMDDADAESEEKESTPPFPYLDSDGLEAEEESEDFHYC